MSKLDEARERLTTLSRRRQGMINQISTWLVERINRAGQRRVDRERAQLERLQSEIITGDPEELSQVFDEDGRLWSER